MKIQVNSKYIFACIFISISLTGCPHYKVEEVDYNSPQKQAAILIGDPQIYSRASLINDRRQETEYLQQLLRNSAVDDTGKSRVNFNPQIIRDLKTVEALSANLGLSFGKVSNTSSATDIKQQIEVTKLQVQLATLQKQVEGINNASAPQVTIPSPDLATANLSTPQTNTSATVTWPDVSALQKSIKDIQGQLKDLSSFNQAPAAPSNSYSALADPRDDFIDRQAYRRDIRAALAESQLDDVHDRGGNALYRLQFSATILPPNGNSKQWGVSKMEIEAPKLAGTDIKSNYFNWLAYLSTMLSAQNVHHNNNYDRYIYKIGRQGYFNVVDIFSNAEGHSYCLNHQTASDDWLESNRKYGGTWVPEKNVVSGTTTTTWYSIKSTYAAPISLFPVDVEKSLCDNYPSYGQDVIFSKRQVDEEAMKAEDMIIRSNPNKPGMISVKKAIRPEISAEPIYNWPEIVLFCQTIVSKSDVNRCKDIGRSSEFVAAGGGADESECVAKSYSVLPRELVQRLGVTTESSQSLQTALSVAAQLSATTQGSLDVAYLSQADARAEALSRQPLVVGFAGSGPLGQSSNSYFGWLFGPQFIVQEPKELSLRQTVRNYGVNSDISVPGWWKSLTLNISSVWIDNWSKGDLLHQSDGADGSHIKKTISLPMTDATYESLTNFIAAKDIGEQYSQLFAQYVVPDVVPACASSVTFQIGGANIWRADSIFLGGVKAKGISVLPDMNGVAAEFDMASVFGSLVNTDSTVQKIPLMVSAEQGSASPLSVFVVGKRQSINNATTCQSPLVLPTTLDSLPPTVTSFSPSEICTDTKSFPLVIQGLNLQERSTYSAGTFTSAVKSEYFTKDGEVTVNEDKTQLVVNLKRNKSIDDNLRLAPKTVPLVMLIDGKSLIVVNVTIKDCTNKATTPQIVSLITSSVKKAKD